MNPARTLPEYTEQPVLCNMVVVTQVFIIFNLLRRGLKINCNQLSILSQSDAQADITTL